MFCLYEDMLGPDQTKVPGGPHDPADLLLPPLPQGPGPAGVVDDGDGDGGLVHHSRSSMSLMLGQ